MSVTQCTDNTELFFETSPELIIGRTCRDVFPREISHAINNLLGSPSLKGKPVDLHNWELKGQKFQLSLARNQGRLFIEIEPLQSNEPPIGNWVRELEVVISTVADIQSIEEIIDRSVIGLRRALGFERVMFFKKESDANFQFISEAYGPYLSSGQALKISKNANQAASVMKSPKACYDFAKNTKQLLSLEETTLMKIESEASNILTSASYAVPYVDQQALLGDDVQSFVTFPLVIEGETWGVFEGHHVKPRMAGRNMRDALDLFSNKLSFLISGINQSIKITELSGKLEKISMALEKPNLSQIDLAREIKGILSPSEGT